MSKIFFRSELIFLYGVVREEADAFFSPGKFIPSPDTNPPPPSDFLCTTQVPTRTLVHFPSGSSATSSRHYDSPPGSPRASHRSPTSDKSDTEGVPDLVVVTRSQVFGLRGRNAFSPRRRCRKLVSQGAKPVLSMCALPEPPEMGNKPTASKMLYAVGAVDGLVSICGRESVLELWDNGAPVGVGLCLWGCSSAGMGGGSFVERR